MSRQFPTLNTSSDTVSPHGRTHPTHRPTQSVHTGGHNPQHVVRYSQSTRADTPLNTSSTQSVHTGGHNPQHVVRHSRSTLADTPLNTSSTQSVHTGGHNPQHVLRHSQSTWTQSLVLNRATPTRRIVPRPAFFFVTTSSQIKRAQLQIIIFINIGFRYFRLQLHFNE